MSYAPAQSRPIVLERSTEAQVYLLFGLALALTVGGVWIGLRFAPVLLGTGLSLLFVLLELALIVTAGWWARQSPLNIVLFGAFPILSGITFTPYLLSILGTYANGAVIVGNALAATACTAAAAAVFAKTTSWNLSTMGRALFFALISLLVMGLLQIFIPGLRSTGAELLISGVGAVVFALYTAMHIQQIGQLSRFGTSPFLLALSLYLDIYNLFLMLLRFMTALSGDRR